MLCRARTLLVLLSLTAAVLYPQEKSQKYWVYFRDKDESALHSLAKKATSEEIAQATGISERALMRRAKVLPPDHLVSAEDLPVSPAYLRQLEHMGIAVINTSRWFNAATAVLNDDQRAAISSLPYVDRVEPVKSFTRRDVPQLEIPFAKKDLSSAISTIHSYGPSLTQLAEIKAVDVHNIRITGKGVLVGMLDSGFRWRIPEATKNMNVIKEYDFIQHDSVTANESGNTPVDRGDQDGHGTITMSTVGGYMEGQLVSPAFGASFILAKTEYVPSETNIEEDNWVAGIEWEEQNGVDVVSSSLGYSDFDATDASGNPQHSYATTDMNGRTATTSKAAVLAARRGVVVCSAMGNEGATSWHILTSPADADSIISVGAVNSSGVLASFSSVGPTADGRTKPDVVALGVSTYSATTSPTTYTFSNGTSLSTPLVAGAAALILSAHPELTPIQVRDALRNTGSNAGSPNINIGWGIIDTYQAILSLGLALSTDPEIALTPDTNTSVGIFAVSNTTIAKDSVRLFYSTNGGATFSSTPMTLTDIVDSAKHAGKYTAIIPKQLAGSKVKFYATAVDATQKPRATPYGAPANLFDFTYGLSNVTITPVPTTFELYQNFPNPFNPSTNIQYSLEHSAFTTLKVYDVLGREMATLVNEYQTAGLKPFVTFDGSRLASGMYFYRLKSGDYSAVKKMVVKK